MNSRFHHAPGVLRANRSRIWSRHQPERLPRKVSTITLILAALILASCTSYKVSERRPRLLPPPGTGLLLLAEKTMAKGRTLDKRAPLEALGSYVSALEYSARELKRNPKDPIALRDYNFALGRIFSTIRDGNLDPWTKPLALSGSDGQYVLTYQPDPRPQWNPVLWEFTPSDQLDIGIVKMEERSTKKGIGAPLVARRKEMLAGARKDFLPDRPYYGVTAVAHFEDRRCVIKLEDPLAEEEVTVDGHRYPLAADYTAPLAVMLAQADVRAMGIGRLLRPGSFQETARISRLEPFRMDKTIVLCIHGLMDSPATWAPLLNSLQADPSIRKEYQFWFFSYPSGYPYPHSAAILRDQLDAMQKHYSNGRKIIVVGHSMGGCISRLLITDAEDKIWMGIFGKRPEEVPLSPENRELLTRATIFRHRSEVGRVIFISAPLRGSDLASNWIGRLGSSLVKAPSTLLGAGRQALKATLTLGEGDLRMTRIPNSVDTLAPNNRFVRLVNTVPVTRGIPHHTIIGDRGRGDSPKSSDGVVPYWSSHMDSAESERIVPSGHGAHQHPQAIEEVRRILKLHTRS